jgi:FkbH-like protein
MMDSPQEIRLALLASCNIDLLLSPLCDHLSERGFHCTTWNAGFNQYHQAILDPDSGLYRSDCNAIILWIDSADLFAEYLANPFESEEEPARIAQRCHDRLRTLVRRILDRLPSATIFLNTLNTPGIDAFFGLEYNSRYSFRQVVTTYNLLLGALAKENPSVIVLDAETLATEVGLRNWYDPRLWYLGRIRHSAHAIETLAKCYSNTIAARWGKSRKCIVLDLDNILWGGVAGEDGPEGIQIGYEGIGLAYREFQQEILSLQRKGFLLAICSKNNPDDALEIIRANPAMHLRETHFSAMEINWNDKARNIRSIATRLNLGLDSFVFIDDSPVERQRVRESLPDVLVPEWPSDPTQYKSALLQLASEHLLKFDLTNEDKQRGTMYSAQAERQKLAESADDIENFYRSLGMKVRIGLADERTALRISQLTQKTNQFNLTTRRYTEAAIRDLALRSSHRVYWLEMDDKFGANGLVGVLILRQVKPGAWMIDTFLLSCRVIGLTVEAEIASKLIGEFVPTAKNEAVANLYGSLGFARMPTKNGSEFWELELSATSVAIPEWFDISHQSKVTLS